MKKFLISFILFLFITSNLFTEEKKEIPIALKADNIIYFPDLKTTIAKGNVKINYKDVNVSCNYVEIDTKEDILLAEGEIFFEQEKNKLNGDALKYDLKEKEGIIYKASGFQDPFYFNADKIRRISKDSKIYSTTLTTCDLHFPHYHLGAKEFLIYSEDKIVAKKISFWIGKEHFASFPKYVINLKEKKRQPFSPRIGHNQWEGWYIKTLYNYYLTPVSFGSLYLDIMEKKGIGKGFEHKFLLPREGELKTYLYHLDKREPGGNFLLKTNYKQPFKNALKLEADTSYDYQITPYLRQIKVLNSRFSLSKISKNYQSILNSNIRYTGGISDFREYRTVYQNINSYKDSKLSILFDHLAIQQKDENTNFELNTKVDFTKNTKYYNLILTVQRRFDLDGDKYTQDRYPSLDRIPEGIGTIPLYYKNKKTPFTIKTLLARYHDGTRNISHAKYEVGGEFLKLYNITKNSKLNLRNSFYQDFYSQNSAKYQAGIISSISTQHTKYLSSNFSHNYLDTRGHSPFLFDRTGRNNYLTGGLSYSIKSKYTLSTNSGYDFRTKKYQNLITKFVFSPELYYKLELNHEYDLNQHEPRDLTTGFYLKTGVYDSKTNLRYDLKNGKTRSINQELNARIGRWWKLQHKSAYNATSKKYIYSDTLLIRDLHCWEAKFLYKDVTKEFWMELNIKAFPTESVKIGVDETGTQYQTTLFSF